MRIGVGFFCSTWDNRYSTNHKLRLSRLSRETLLDTFERNLRDFVRLLELSCSMGLTIFRLGSDFIPFASHERFERDWLYEIEKSLEVMAGRLREYGIRITMHPGQFVVLNSPRADVVERSLRELEYHFWVLDKLGLGKESIVVIHVGGVYGDKREALRRFTKTVKENYWLTRRLAVENDERYYTVADVVELGEELGIPVVFDYYHHVLNPSNFDIDKLRETWRGVIPEFHVSSAPDKGRALGEHGDYLRLEDFLALVNLWEDRGPLDVIVEAKKKEKAIEKLLLELGKLRMELRRPPCYHIDVHNI
ncbi:MAG: UV DNA damage repair endonuclease UvsE [Desulfurococcaceae archaeon]